jgi:coenzyme F420 hydrogenase subunit beta
MIIGDNGVRRIRNIADVVEWGLCIGCGICYSICEREAIRLQNFYEHGIRPIVDREKCSDVCSCLSFCPGYTVDARLLLNNNDKHKKYDIAFGPVLEIWEGYATDDEIRFAASSGGALTALSLYCLEQEKMGFVLHTEMDPGKPWENRSTQSRNRSELVSKAGSRYAPSSPCDQLELIQKSDKPCIFIGKPCDAAAVFMARRQLPMLDKNLGLVLTFFCAGAPSTNATLNMLAKLEIAPEQVNNIRYRGNGWPGGFFVSYDKDAKNKFITYRDSWHEMQKYRSFRCHLCPDGLGQIADISCGDAWHKYADDGDSGRSIILVRTERGRTLLHRAIEAGYLQLQKIERSDVIAAQGLIKRKPEIFGRLVAMQMLAVPVPKFVGFDLFKSWSTLSLWRKIETVLGTLRRIVQRGLFRRNPLIVENNIG